MADINLVGVGFNDGRNRPYGITDIIVDSSGTTLTTTGLGGNTGLLGFTGLNTGAQGETGIVANGFVGFTGLPGIQGFTGVKGDFGQTGLAGITGTGGQGFQGLFGATGLVGSTGLVGGTGIAGITGISLQGETGILGITGTQGRTGIGVSGVTGLSGSTGLLGETGLQGFTGVAVQGLTGFQGITGIYGTTGVFSYQTLDVQTQITGFTLLYSIPANTLSSDGQQLSYSAWGRTAGATTLLSITYGNDVVISEYISENNTDFGIKGVITNVDTATQEVIVKVIGNSYSLVEIYPSTVIVSGIANFAISVASAGSGHVIYALLFAKY